ncbi:MAG: bacteriohemerythrin [Alphaproteobacteria bacterium]|nr:bacteriohemerythrin [Alphaproteobacteria bacterium]
MLWNPLLETGIKEIDEQHKELFRQIRAMRDSKDSNRVDQLLDFLGKYVITHFLTEEDMQTRSGYPLAAEHKKLHELLIETYDGMRKEYASDKSTIVFLKINKALGEWLIDHVMGQDKHFADYYKSLTKK